MCLALLSFLDCRVGRCSAMTEELIAIHQIIERHWLPSSLPTLTTRYRSRVLIACCGHRLILRRQKRAEAAGEADLIPNSPPRRRYGRLRLSMAGISAQQAGHLVSELVPAPPKTSSRESPVDCAASRSAHKRWSKIEFGHYMKEERPMLRKITSTLALTIGLAIAGLTALPS